MAVVKELPYKEYTVPTGSGEQIRAVNVGSPNAIRVYFSEPVTGIGSPPPTNAITIQGLTQTYTVSVSGWAPSLNAASFTLNSTTHPNGFTRTVGGTVYRGDKLTITLNANQLTKPSSTTQLDGEFATNPSSLTSTGTSTLPTGNGVPTGNMTFRVIVLPGDFNCDNKVDLSDFGIIQANFGTGTTYAQGDADGDGDVDLSDFGIFQQNNGTNWTTF